MSKFDNKVFKRKYQRSWYRHHKKRALKWMTSYYRRNRKKIQDLPNWEKRYEMGQWCNNPNCE